MKIKPAFQQKLIQVLTYGVFLIIVLVPFHAFFTTWIGSNTAGLLLLRGWKELMLIFLVAGALYLFAADKKLRERFLKDWLFVVMAIFSAWLLLATIIMGRDHDAALLGLTIHLRPLLFFMVATAAVFYYKVPEKVLTYLVAIPAVGVVAFGLLQMFALPHDFLKHFGYKKNITIPPYFTIDEQVDKIRIASTLRGPNPLGVYLIAPITLLLSRIKNLKSVIRYTLYVIPLLIVLFGSHSRSAWLGASAAGALYIWLVVSKKWKIILCAAAVAVGLVGVGAIYHYRQTSFVQDVILHDNPEEGGTISSNQGHLQGLRAGFQDVEKRPLLGCGAGCAGPASAHHENGGKVSENFYLQTAQEAGIVGLGLLLIIQVAVAVKLLRVNTHFSKAWVAVFVGISVASLLSHAWADDTITYIWWGIAGLLLGQSTRTKNKV